MNVNFKELVLYLLVFVCLVLNCVDVIVNLVCCNIILEKLEIWYLIVGIFDVKKFDGFDFKFDFGGVFEVNYILKEFGCFYDFVGLLGIVVVLEVLDICFGC